MSLSPTTDFERYREGASKRFIAMARTKGQHSFHDLDELAQDFYAQFWADWLEHPKEDFDGLAVPYIAGAMLNMMSDLSRRGRSVRSPELVQVASEEILATVASEDISPVEQLVLQEEMWLVNEVIHSLPARLQVVFKAVFSRDTKKKGSPLAGYKLAAQQLGVSEARAKKLSLEANKRIRLAVERIEAGEWCDRWAASIELVASGSPATPEFIAHADHCVMCRLGVAHLRRQAAILPLPLLPLAEHVGVLARVWHQGRTVYVSTRQQLTALFGRHAAPVSEAAGGVVGSSGAAGVAGAGIVKVGALCLAGAMVAGGAASVCLKGLGVPAPIINAVASDHPRAHERTAVHQYATADVRAVIRVAPPTPRPTIIRVAAQARVTPERSRSPVETYRQPADQAPSETQREFNPGAGSSTPGYESSALHGSVTATARVASTASSPPVEPQTQLSRHHSQGRGTVQSGESDEFAP